MHSGGPSRHFFYIHTQGLVRLSQLPQDRLGRPTPRAAPRPPVRALGLSRPAPYQAKLAPAEVTSVLRANEYVEQFEDAGPIKYFDTNSLGSNSPIEDSHAAALTTHHGGLLLGIFDGHGGAACGQVVAKRLLHYIAAGLLSPADLARHRAVWEEGRKESLVQTFNDNFELVKDLKERYQRSYTEYLAELQGWTADDTQEHDIEDILVHAFCTLDNDMSREAIPAKDDQIDMKTLTVAMSGCVAVAAHIDGPHLSVASTGDCTAVVGSLSDTDTWLAKKLTNEHNSDNNKEVKRILSEHPESEHHHIIKGDRLLSMLAPLRAFGDFKFKVMRPFPSIVRIVLDTSPSAVAHRHDREHPGHCARRSRLPAQLQDPALPYRYVGFTCLLRFPFPSSFLFYVPCRPEVSYHHLTPRDKFLVLGSDGLWDLMTPMQVTICIGWDIFLCSFLARWCGLLAST
jgi:pyruvate dehydrogenase phosphatase